MKLFKDRIEAGRKLAQRLIQKYPKIDKAVVLALPRGGVIVAKEIAQIMNLPLDIIVTRKIGHPYNPEYAVAALSEHSLILSPEESVEKEHLKNEVKNEREEIRRRLQEYRGGKPRLDLNDKVVFIVDDGIATGLTTEAAIKEIRFYRPKKIILAVPVAPKTTLNKFKKITDEIVCLESPFNFYAVGQFYKNFDQIKDEEVKKSLS
jgi:predicted phosphoribosyltransferase